MISFLKLIRFQNLLLIALMQGLLHFVFLRPQPLLLGLSDWQFGLLMLSTVLIAAGGYVINNILDVTSDLVNKPGDVVVGKGISEGTAYYIYFGLTVAGLAIGFYLSNLVGHANFLIVFGVTAWMLYLYSSNFKKQLLIGNFLVAVCLGLSVLLVALFDIVPAVFTENRELMAVVFQIICNYAAFAFLLGLLREIVKDAEDVDGDWNAGMNTLPIAIGRVRTARIASVFGALLAVLLGWYVYAYLFALIYVVFYTLIFLMAPLLFFAVRCWSAEKQKDFYFCGQLLKWITVFGIFLIVVVSLNRQFYGS